LFLLVKNLNTIINSWTLEFIHNTASEPRNESGVLWIALDVREESEVTGINIKRENGVKSIALNVRRKWGPGHHR
jgi:hypothetical protein